MIAFSTIFGFGDRLPVSAYNDRTNRHFSSIAGGLSESDRPLHPASMEQIFGMIKGRRRRQASEA
jgi:hypothetical protein